MEEVVICSWSWLFVRAIVFLGKSVQNDEGNDNNGSKVTNDEEFSHLTNDES